MRQDTNKRIAELSATLAKIENPLTDTQFNECWGMANDFICYNSPYYYNGYQQVDFGSTLTSCIMQKIGEFQVLRFMAFDVYMSGDCMYEYLMNQFAHNDDDDWMDDNEYEEDELTLENAEEYKQIWIDRNGNATTIILKDMECYEDSTFVTIESTQDWLGDLKVTLAILDSVKEYSDFCYTNGESQLNKVKNAFLMKVRKFNPTFIDEIVEHGFFDNFIHYHRTMRIAFKHKFEMPVGYEDIRNYFEMLSSYQREGKCMTEPRFINPVNVLAEYRKRNAEMEKKREERLKKEAEMAEKDFNKNHSYLFGIEFDSDRFHYQSLDSVEAYRIEGKIMHHCVFSCGYYKNHEYLTMHVSDHEGNRVATCSVNVEKGSIVELQTMCNERTWRQGDEYKEIWNTLMARMHTFPKRVKETKKQTRKRKVA